MTTADRKNDVRMLLYGFHLRGISAHARDAESGSPDRWAILVDEVQADRARAALEAVWAAILECEAARTPEGRCAFCGYDMTGVPLLHDRPMVCPECGVDLRSIAARRAWREGRRPRIV